MPTTKRRTSKTITGFAATRSSRGITRQAAADVDRGLVDTDQRGKARRVLRNAPKKKR